MYQNLNIITLNIPYPPDYGGMIDTFYRIKELHSLGIKIHLHCFEYGRRHSVELESLCSSVNYYSRKSGLLQHLSAVPYIVKTRRSGELLKNIKKNDYPVLFDGLHTTYYLKHKDLSGRKKLIRLHNIEHKYYRSLSKNETNIIKKLYFLIESFRLMRYERVIGKADYIFPITLSEQGYFENKYHNSIYLAPFHPFKDMTCQRGKGEYIIYHGDLSVNENISIIENLILNVFSRIPYQCVIAGKNPPGHVLYKASLYSNIQVIANPDSKEMSELISNAQIQLLPSLESNGFKLKLLIALYSGRHCLCNSITTEDSTLRNLCAIADSNDELIEKINSMMNIVFTREMIQNRQEVLLKYFNNAINARILLANSFSQ